MDDQPNRETPPGRQALFFGGIALMVIGFLLFLSPFATMACAFSDAFSRHSAPGDFGPSFDNVEEHGARIFRSFGAAIVGFALLVAGIIAMTLGRAGVSGSGANFDSTSAREDPDSWSRSGGGAFTDGPGEARQSPFAQPPPVAPPVQPPPLPIVKVRCRACEALNDENAHYCRQCGAKL